MNDNQSVVLKMIQAKYPGYHPLLSLVDIALNDDATLNLQADCHKTIAKYCESELRSVEVRAEVKGDFGMLRVIVDNDLLGIEDAEEVPKLGSNK